MPSVKQINSFSQTFFVKRKKARPKEKGYQNTNSYRYDLGVE